MNSNQQPPEKSLVHEKAQRPNRLKSFEKKLAELEAQAKKLREKMREEQRRERDENIRHVLVLLKSEEMEDYRSEVWKRAIGQIKAALEREKALIGKREKPRPSELVGPQPFGEDAELGRGSVVPTP